MKLIKIQLHKDWKIDRTFIDDDILHFYYKDKYYTTIDGFFKCETNIYDIIKRFNRDIKIKKILKGEK